MMMESVDGSDDKDSPVPIKVRFYNADEMDMDIDPPPPTPTPPQVPVQSKSGSVGVAGDEDKKTPTVVKKENAQNVPKVSVGGNKQKKKVVESDVDSEDEDTSKEIDETELEEEGVHDVMNSYFDHCGPASQMLDSYNHFMQYSLPKIIKKCGRLEQEEVMPNKCSKVSRASMSD
jgi:hypothetical protein